MAGFPAMNAQLVNVQPTVSVPNPMATDLTQAEQTMLTNIQYVSSRFELLSFFENIAILDRF